MMIIFKWTPVYIHTICLGKTTTDGSIGDHISNGVKADLKQSTTLHEVNKETGNRRLYYHVVIAAKTISNTVNDIELSPLH